MTHFDGARMLIIGLLAITVWSMATVTWRLNPSMQWDELLGRLGITLVFASVGGNTIRAINAVAQYTIWTWLLTTALMLTTLAFVHWARRLRRRPLRKRKEPS